MKILITGHKGFIGSWLTFALASENHQIYGIDNNSSYGKRLYDEASLSKFVVNDFRADITNFSKVKKYISEINPDIIVHLAAQAIIPRAFSNPFETFMSNAIGTLTISECCRQNTSIKSMICITSDKVYSNANNGEAFTESSEIGGNDIYSISKSTAEMICRVYANTHKRDNLNIQTLRLGNVVGGGDWSVNRLIPDLIEAANTGKNFKVRYENATRPFQHISDVVNGIMKIAFASANDGIETLTAWNLGPKDNSFAYVRDVISGFKKMYSSLIVEQSTDKIKEDMKLSVDVSRYKAKFGEPKYTSEESIEQTLNWYNLYHKENKNPIRLMEEDLAWIKN
jgi:CDP-glucose 4,6-dehydratase